MSDGELKKKSLTERKRGRRGGFKIRRHQNHNAPFQNACSNQSMVVWFDFIKKFELLCN